MTTALFLLRCLQIGLSLSDLGLVTIGMVDDMYVEYALDDHDWGETAGQADFDAF